MSAAAWSAPGRVNLIGEHTDYNGGLSLPFGINRRTQVRVSLRMDQEIRLHSAQESQGVVSSIATARQAQGWTAYPLGVVWALSQERDLSQAPGFDAEFTSDVPIGAGVSSSAALEACLATALNDLWDLGLSKPDLVRVCQRAENEVAGAPTGSLDQSAVIYAQRDHGVLLNFANGSVEDVLLGFAPAHLQILVMDSTISHDHTTGGYGERRAECEAAAAALGVENLSQVSAAGLDSIRELLTDKQFRRVRHVVTDNARTLRTAELLTAGEPRQIGPLLTESHVSLRDDYEISIPAIDTAVEAAVAAGALGARLTGGGFGGSSIALVDEERAEQVQAQVAAAVTAAGYPLPRFFAVTASRGAGADPN